MHALLTAESRLKPERNSESEIFSDEIEALSKIRNKTCVPSLLWQRLAGAGVGGEIEPLLLRRAVYGRLKKSVTFLQEQGFFSQVEICEVAEKPGWVVLKIEGVTEKFFQGAELVGGLGIGELNLDSNKSISPWG